MISTTFEAPPAVRGRRETSVMLARISFGQQRLYYYTGFAVAPLYYVETFLQVFLAVVAGLRA